MQDLAWRNEVLSADVPRLRALARRARQAKTDDARAAAQTKFDALLNESRARRTARAAALPQPTFPEELPVSAQREAIAHAIAQHPVVIVCGETGSGKTTQLPKICLSIGRGAAGLIGHTQPRRIAARATATRIAQELNTPLGQTVGFKVRFTDQVGEHAAIKLMTDGILLAETQSDPSLSRYDTLIIDEAHERSANIDFLLG
ncbi:MAG: DEAD/DEAH box helicase, partial [Rhodocyclaceae bacterium]|nr:DEAD/DEAH box helicase [Rhodocyclaceae bacterium]